MNDMEKERERGRENSIKWMRWTNNNKYYVGKTKTKKKKKFFKQLSTWFVLFSGVDTFCYSLKATGRSSSVQLYDQRIKSIRLNVVTRNQMFFFFHSSKHQKSIHRFCVCVWLSVHSANAAFNRFDDGFGVDGLHEETRFSCRD